MKLNKFYFILTLFIGSCAKDGQEIFNSDICVLFDRTDSIHINYEAINIASVCDFELSIWKSARVEIGGISDVSINSSKIFILPSENYFSGNPKIRELKVNKFNFDIRNALTQSASLCTSSLKHSIVFPTVISSLNMLSRRRTENKHLIICSNLLENSSAISFYDTATVNRIFIDPAGIRKELLIRLSIASLQNIQVWLMYTPQTHEENNLYMQIANEIYKPILEAKGAIVHIGNSVQ